MDAFLMGLLHNLGACIIAGPRLLSLPYLALLYAVSARCRPLLPTDIETQLVSASIYVIVSIP